MPKEMSDLILEAFQEKQTKMLGWNELWNFCAAHSSELRTPLNPHMDWRELVFLTHQGLSALRRQGAVKVIIGRKGYIDTIERL